MTKMKFEKLYTAVLRSNTHGSSMLEYAILAGLISIASISAIQPVGRQIELIMLRADAALAADKHKDAIATDGCFDGTDDAEAVAFIDGTTCYRLGNGPDYFFADQATQDLVVSSGFGSGAQIETGSGNDTLMMAQSGNYATGPGDDILTLALSEKSPGPSNINLGPGNDTLNMTSIPLPARLPRHRLVTGPGDKKINLDCGNDLVEMQLSANAKATLSGSCAIELYQEAGASAGITSVSGQGLRGISGVLTGNIALNTTLAPNAAPHAITVRDASLLDINYVAKVQASSSFKIIGAIAGNHPSSNVNIDIAAASGSFILDSAGAENWQVKLAYGPGGTAAFDFPDEASFSRMSFPSLTGVVDIVRIGGCFDSISIQSDSAPQTLNSDQACPIDDQPGSNINIPADATSLTLHRGGGATIMALGANGLRSNVLTFSR
jgi:Flp pilus assembly pilin Flp